MWRLPRGRIAADDLTGQTGPRPILATRKTNDTDGGSHNTSRGPRHKRNRARIVATLKYQELEAQATIRLPRLPARTGPSSSLSSAVTNPGCDRTAGKIPRSGILVNRTLEILCGILIFTFDRPGTCAIKAWRSGRRRRRLRRAQGPDGGSAPPPSMPEAASTLGNEAVGGTCRDSGS